MEEFRQVTVKCPKCRRLLMQYRFDIYGCAIKTLELFCSCGNTIKATGERPPTKDDLLRP